MKYKIVCFLLVLIVLQSCIAKQGTNFEFVNQTNLVIDSLELSTSTKVSTVNIGTVHPGRKVSLRLDMSEEDYVDGNYKIDVFAGSSISSFRFGYFTNGSPLEEIVEITYWGDSVSCRSHGPNRDY